MNKLSIVLCSYLMFSISGFVQLNAQSMSNEEIDVLYDDAFSLLISNPDSALYLANQIAEQSTISKYEYGQTKSRILAGYYFWNKRKLDTAKMVLESSLLHFENNHKNTLEHGRALLYLGMVNHSSQQQLSAKSNTQNALNIFEKIGSEKYQSNALNILGAIEMGRTNYAKALDYFSKAYQHRLNNNTPEEDCLREISNIALVYSRMGQYEKSLQLTKKTLSLATKKKDLNTQINILNSLGVLFKKLNSYDSAEYYYTQCQELAVTQSRFFMAYLAGYNIANMYSVGEMYEKSNQLMYELSQNDFDPPAFQKELGTRLLAKNYLELGIYDSSILLARPLLHKVIDKGGKQSAVLVSDILARSHEHLSQYDSAYYYLRTQLTYQDSIYNLASQQELSSIYAELETMEKEKEIYALQLERYETKANIAVVAIIIIFILSSLIFIFWVYKKQQEKIQLISEEKEKQLELELENTKQKLSNHTLSMIHKNSAFVEIEEGIKGVIEKNNGSADPELRKIMSSININKTLENDWNNFVNLFDDLHHSFFSIIADTHTDLSDYEYRLCALIKLKLANKEIATILNIEYKSVKMAKYRLKKKLNISEEMSLSGYLAQI